MREKFLRRVFERELQFLVELFYNDTSRSGKAWYARLKRIERRPFLAGCVIRYRERL